MADIELLDVSRAARFISFTLESDMQVKVNRSVAAGLLRSSLSREGDLHIVEYPAEKFDKVMTFFSENDQQVHYQSKDTVGVYALTRLLGELRRMLRDYHMPRGLAIGNGPPMMSPRGLPASGPSSDYGPGDDFSRRLPYGTESQRDRFAAAPLEAAAKVVQATQAEASGEQSRGPETSGKMKAQIDVVPIRE